MHRKASNGAINPARCGLVGTMEFMSPEVVAREEAQAASDMWSVGVLVFMMVGFIITIL